MSRRPPPRIGRAVAAGAIAGAVALAGCGATPDSYEQRMQDTYAFVEAWEGALEGDAEDRGWSMLSAQAQGGFEGDAQYVALADAADWSTFDLQPLTGACDDLYACSVSVLVVGGQASVPEFLLRSPNDQPDNAFRLVGLVDLDGDRITDSPDPEAGNAFVQVLWERVPWPAPGIDGGGG